MHGGVCNAAALHRSYHERRCAKVQHSQWLQTVTPNVVLKRQVRRFCHVLVLHIYLIAQTK
jgi:hypothetical protein